MVNKHLIGPILLLALLTGCETSKSYLYRGDYIRCEPLCWTPTTTTFLNRQYKDGVVIDSWKTTLPRDPAYDPKLYLVVDHARDN